MKNKRILISGGTGSLGHGLVHRLVKDNKIVVLSRNEERQFLMKKEFSDYDNSIKFIIGDVRDQETVESALWGCDTVIHAAAMKDLIICEDQPYQTCLNNITGTFSLLQVVKKSKTVKNFCAISTDKAAAPTSVYGATKYIMEKLVLEATQSSDICFSVVRFGNMIDSKGSIISLWKDNPPKDVKLNHPDLTRFFFTVDDAVDTVLHTMENAHSGEIFIRRMKAAKIQDVFSVLLNRDRFESGSLFPGEKIHEDLTSEEELPFCHIEGDFYIIRPGKINLDPPTHLHSGTADLFTKEQLRKIIYK